MTAVIIIISVVAIAAMIVTVASVVDWINDHRIGKPKIGQVITVMDDYNERNDDVTLLTVLCEDDGNMYQLAIDGHWEDKFEDEPLKIEFSRYNETYKCEEIFTENSDLDERITIDKETTTYWRVKWYKILDPDPKQVKSAPDVGFT